jgi:hypothetical protein
LTTLCEGLNDRMLDLGKVGRSIWLLAGAVAVGLTEGIAYAGVIFLPRFAATNFV